MRHGAVMPCDVHTRPLKDHEAVQTETDETDKTEGKRSKVQGFGVAPHETGFGVGLYHERWHLKDRGVGVLRV